MNTVLEKNRAVTSKEVAAVAGVSQATVSRVFAARGNVQPHTENLVREVASRLGYRPNAMARAMRTSRSGTVGVVVSRLANPLYPLMLQTLGPKMSAAGLRMVVWSADQDDETFAVDALKEGSVDGVLMMTATTGSSALREAVKSNLPVVLINRVLQDVPLDQIESDNHAGGARVAQYLVRAGRSRIAMISGPQDASTIRNREAGFRDQMESCGVELQKQFTTYVRNFSYQAGFDAATRLLELANPPNSIFCANDVLALGARDAARRRGISVPDELWLVGYDDIEMASWEAFDLTTIRQPLDEMCQLATDRLVERMGGSKADPVTIVVRDELIIRGSTARHSFLEI
ncbi:MAG: transcriptional regulator, LacI family [Polaromonas sp.]|nr:transcriptional regulator, LacI family [Polaromonas sp.]